MAIDQRNAGAAITPVANGGYTVDRFSDTVTQSSKLTFQQVTDAPAGFSNSMKIMVASTATAGAGDQFRFNQAIEGYNIADFAWGTASASAISVSFWAKASVAGTYSVTVWNFNLNRSFVSTVALTSSWAKYSILISGDTSGSWSTAWTNGVGLELIFDLGNGSTWETSTLNSWQAATKMKATGSVSLVSNAAATLNITGVQLEKGSTATAFDYRPYGTELALCQRYYSIFPYIIVNLGTTFTIATFPVTMRGVPTIAGGGAGFSVNGANTTVLNCSQTTLAAQTLTCTAEL